MNEHVCVPATPHLQKQAHQHTGSSLLTAELRDPLLGRLENRGTVSKPEAGLEHHLGMTCTVLSNLTVLREGTASSHQLARDSGLGTQPGRKQRTASLWVLETRSTAGETIFSGTPGREGSTTANLYSSQGLTWLTCHV